MNHEDDCLERDINGPLNKVGKTEPQHVKQPRGLSFWYLLTLFATLSVVIGAVMVQEVSTQLAEIMLVVSFALLVATYVLRSMSGHQHKEE